MITYEDFVIDFPEFANTALYAQVRVERAIVRASNQVDPELVQASEMVANLAAHMLAVATPGIAGGAGTGAIGSLSVSSEYTVSYIQPSSASKLAESPLSATSYGKEFQRLLDSISFTPVVV